jgi:hypothetical protein
MSCQRFVVGTEAVVLADETAQNDARLRIERQQSGVENVAAHILKLDI